MILDYLHGLRSMEEVTKQLNVNKARGYQLRDALFKQYRVPVPYQQHGPACARWVAGMDYRYRYQPAQNTPEWFYYNERFGER